MEGDILPALGKRPIAQVTSEDLLKALRAIEKRGAVEMARRVKNYVHDIFEYAKAERLVTHNPADGLTRALKTPAPPKRRNALKASELPQLLARLGAYDGDKVTALALKFTLRTFVRTSEARFAVWSEFEGLDGAEPLWRIPPERMKVTRGRPEHLVPLSSQAVEVLGDLRAATCSRSYLFPGERRGVSAS